MKTTWKTHEENTVNSRISSEEKADAATYLESLSSGIMKKQIKDLQDYFKSKLCRGEFEITKIENTHTVVTIDSEYVFCLYNCVFSDKVETYMDSCMHLPFSESETLTIFNHIKDARDKAEKAKKLVEYEALKKELNK